MTSRAVARLHEDRVELEVEMSAESAWVLLGEPATSAPDVGSALPRPKEPGRDIHARLLRLDRLLRRGLNPLGSAPTGSVRFFVGGNPVGRSPLTNGLATLALNADMPAGAYAVTAQFTSANPPYLDAASAPAALDVSRENAAAYTGDVALMTALPARWPAPADENCARPKRY